MLPICADPAVVLTVSDRTEQALRLVPQAQPATDLGTIPTIALDVHERRWDSWIAAYPLFAVHDLQADAPQRGALALAQGAAGLAWHSRHLQITAGEIAAYGLQNFQYLLPLQLAPGQVAAPTQPVPTSLNDFLFATSQSMASVSYAWSRRWSAYVAPQFTIGGGLDDKEHPERSPTQYYPFQRTPRVDAHLDWQFSRITRVETFGSGYVAQFDDRRCDYLTGGSPTARTSLRNSYGICSSEGKEVEWEELVYRRLSTTTEAELGAGGSIAQTRIDAVGLDGALLPSPIPNRVRFFPVATARLWHRFSLHRPEVSRLDAEARLGPVMDLRFGWIDPRLSIRVRETSRYKDTRVKATFEFGQTIPPSEPISTTYIQGELEAVYDLGRRFSVGGGLRWVWQRQTAPTGEEFPFVTAIVYGTILYHEPAIFLAGGHPVREFRERELELER